MLQGFYVDCNTKILRRKYAVDFLLLFFWRCLGQGESTAIYGSASVHRQTFIHVVVFTHVEARAHSCTCTFAHLHAHSDA